MREGRLLEGGGLPGGKQDWVGNQGVGLDHAGGTDRPLLPGLRAHHTWQPRGCAGWGAHTSFRVTTARKLRRRWASLLVRRQTMPQVNYPPPLLLLLPPTSTVFCTWEGEEWLGMVPVA